MARLLRGDRTHLDDAAQVWAEATAFREGDPDVAALDDSRPIIAEVMDRPRSVLVVALDDEDDVIAFAVAAVAREAPSWPKTASPAPSSGST